MKKHFLVFTLVAIGLTLVSCGNGPQSDEYQRCKAELKEINRMNNAGEKVESDARIKNLVAYFDKHGTDADRLKAHYVAGATYRDLQDSPRALEHFFTIADAAADGTVCDSALLGCTYSELHYLYSNVHDNEDALEMARKEYAMDLARKEPPVISASHVGTSLLYMGRAREAEQYFLISLAAAEKDPTSVTPDCFPLLLYDFSRLGNREAARRCLRWIDRDDSFTVTLFALAEYYNEVEGKPDSAEVYCQRILEGEHTLADEYDAYKFLFILKMDSDPQKAVSYARHYIEVCDSFDLGRRQQMAATVNNQHKYFRDMAAEQKLVADRARMQNWLMATILGSTILILLGTLFFIYKKYRHTRAMLEKDAQLQRTTDELADRKRQLSDFIHQMHKAELNLTAEDVLSAISQASEGKHRMSAEDWAQLYQTVDSLHPEFAARLVNRLTAFTEQQKQVLYLLRIGLTNSQIENVTNLSHTTVWRWVKKLKAVVEE